MFISLLHLYVMDSIYKSLITELNFYKIVADHLSVARGRNVLDCLN